LLKNIGAGSTAFKFHVMSNKLAYLYELDTLADWETGYITDFLKRGVI
jgi:hypothetical protein